MAEQVGTPGSNADSSINNGSKAPASKDKSCPFCHQPFTSSSLGRHLDLYIKERNPKPPDGVHDVVEIRKLRGGITRRQPRNSTGGAGSGRRREGSTPGGTPSIPNGRESGSGRRSPASESGKEKDRRPDRSPVMQRYVPDEVPKGGVVSGFLDRPSWQATGVMNDIPPIPSGSDRRGDEGHEARRLNGHRNVSRHLLAKSTFDQKQKLTEALDHAKASELALREVLGSIRAAVERIAPSTTPFSYDPLSLDFPALTLHCLPPPPTLRSISPVPSPQSWSINPPDQQQYDALRSHFASVFNSFRVAHTINPVRRPSDDMLEYPPREPQNETRSSPDSPNEAQNTTKAILAQASELETKLDRHLHATFSHWNVLPQQQRNEYWRLELARAVGTKSDTISSLSSKYEMVVQENSHLRMQVEQLSRCQQPREFQMMPPATVPVDAKVINELGEMGMKGAGVGLRLADKDESLQELVSRSISRWKQVVLIGRKDNDGMSGQRPFSDGLNSEGRGSSRAQSGRPAAEEDVNMDDVEVDADGDIDADADADVEGEVEASSNNPTRPRGKAPQAQMSSIAGSSTPIGLRNGNGNGGPSNPDMPSAYKRGRI